MLVANFTTSSEKDEEVTSLDSLGADIESLPSYGGTHRVVHRFHRCPSKRFPYAVFYRVFEETIRVYAVLDSRRRPAAIRRQLRDGRAKNERLFLIPSVML